MTFVDIFIDYLIFNAKIGLTLTLVVMVIVFLKGPRLFV
jgi:hypothetical protein